MKRCFLTLHVSSFMDPIVAGTVGQRLSMRKIFRKIAEKLTRQSQTPLDSSGLGRATTPRTTRNWRRSPRNCVPIQTGWGFVLEIHAQARKWDAYVDIAGTIIKLAPDNPVYRIGGFWETPCALIRFLRLWGRETTGTTGLSLTPNSRPRN